MTRSLGRVHARGWTILVLVLGTVSCIDDPTAVDDGVPLTQAEAELLGLELWRQAFAARAEAGNPFEDAPLARAPGIGEAPVTIDESATTRISCPAGGEIVTDIRLSGTVDDETGLGEIQLTLNKLHEDCGTDLGDQRLILNADPGITTELVASSDAPGVTAVSGSITGGVDLFLDGTLARCLIDVAFAGVEVEGQASAFAIRGRSCGREIDTRTTSTGGS